MKTMIEKIFSAQIFALMVAMCATGSAWAAVSLEESGGIVTTTEQLAFKNVTLSQLVAGSVRARMFGGAVDDDGKEALAYQFVPDDVENPTYVDCEFQMHDHNYVKCVVVRFTQRGSNVNAVKYATSYDTYNAQTCYPGSGTLTNTNNANYKTSGLSDYNIGCLHFVNHASGNRSINVNFYESGKQLSNESTDMVGMLESAVPAQKWDNVLAGNTVSPVTVNVLASDKTKSDTDGVTVEIAGAMGAWHSGNADTAYPTDVLAGYIDDSAGNLTPTITIRNIPFRSYKVYIYHSNESSGKAFGYDTVNGNNYYYAAVGRGNRTYDGGIAIKNGTSSWGGASTTALSEARNCLVTPLICERSTLTITGHNASDNSSYRSGIAAIQIVEMPELFRWNYSSIYSWSNTPDETFHSATIDELDFDGSDIGDLALSSNWNAKFSSATLGNTLVFKDANKIQKTATQFQDFILSGLYVTSTPASGVYTISASTTGYRPTHLGDKTANSAVETWFVFDESFTIFRPYPTAENASDSYANLYGNLNLKVASSKTFTVTGYKNTRDNKTDNYTSTLQDNAKLKMYGGGTFATPNLVASNTGVWLDYSQATSTPFISGNLTVSSNTSFGFPEGCAMPYQLASGTVSGSVNGSAMDYKVGDATYNGVLELSDKSIYFPIAANLNGNANWTTASWNATPTSFTDNKIEYVINVTDDAQLTVDSSVSAKKVTFNIASGKTLTLVNSDNLSSANGVVLTGTGKLAFTGAVTAFPTLTVSDNATIGLVSDTRLTVSGNIAVADGKTLYVAPGAASAICTEILGFTAASGNIALTSPTESGYTYEIVQSATSINLVRSPFVFDGTVDATPAGWITDFNQSYSEKFTTALRVGPNASMPFVHGVVAGQHPWKDIAARPGKISFALYADVSQVSSSGGKCVLVSFGRTDTADNKILALYREGANVKLAVWDVGTKGTTETSIVGTAASVAAPSAGFHLYTATFDNTNGNLELYLDNASAQTGSAGGAVTLSKAFQLGSICGSFDSDKLSGEHGLANGIGMGFAAIRGYDAVLSSSEVAVLSTQFPATALPRTGADIQLNESGKTLTVYASDVDSATTFGPEEGDVVIAANNTVTVSKFRTYPGNASSGGSNTVTVNGKLIVSQTDSSSTLTEEGDQNKGVVLGFWLEATSGSRETSVVVPTDGEFDAANSYILMSWSGNVQSALLEIRGGTVKTKGLLSKRSGKGKVKLHQGGILEVAEILSNGEAIEKEFWKGTLRITADATETRAVKFCAASVENATILDPNGHTLTLNADAVTGTGYIKAQSSAVGETKGTVSIGGSADDFTGTIIIDDDGKNLITFSNISGYHGNILYKVTGESSLPVCLSGFAGTLTISGGTVDAKANSVDLSNAKVILADGATLLATVGMEGPATVADGTTLKLYASDDVYNYEGHVFSGTTAGTGAVAYYYGATPTAAAAASINGNNLLPYYQIWEVSDGAGSGVVNLAANWKGGAVPGTQEGREADGNAAFHVTGGNEITVTVDKSFEFDELQVFGSGTIVFAQSEGGEYKITTSVMAVSSGVNVKLSGSPIEISDGIIYGGIYQTITVQNGASLPLDDVDCTVKLVVASGGVLTTSGETTLSAYNRFEAGSSLMVAEENGGITRLNAEEQGLRGAITIGEGATLVNTRGSDALKYSAGESEKVRVEIYGSLDMAGTRWTLGPYNEFILHEGALVKGTGDGNGALDTNDGKNIPFTIDGDATISAKLRMMNGGGMTFDVATGKTLTLSGGTRGDEYDTGTLTKTGAGILDVTTATSYTGLTTVSAGQMIQGSLPAGNVSIAEGATFTLKGCNWTNNDDKDKFTGSGTLEIDDTSAKAWIFAKPISFSGIIKAKGDSTNYPVFGGNGTEYPVFGNDPEFILDGTMVLNGCFNNSNTTTGLPVRDFSGSGSVNVNNNQVKDAYRTISSKQTKPTTFSGTFTSAAKDGGYCNSALRVYGDPSVASVYGLTLTGVNTTYGPLTIDTKGKVIFSDSGSWLNGATTVKANGVLESQRNDQVVGALTLEAGSKLSIADGYVLKTGAVTLPEEGTVRVDATALASLTSAGATIIESTSEFATADVAKLVSVGPHIFKLDTEDAKKINVYPAVAKVGDTYYTDLATAEAAVNATTNPSITIYSGSPADASIYHNLGDSTYRLKNQNVYLVGGTWSSSAVFCMADNTPTAVYAGDTVVIDDTHFLPDMLAVDPTGPANATNVKIDKDISLIQSVDGTILAGTTFTIADGATLTISGATRAVTLGAVTFDKAEATGAVTLDGSTNDNDITLGGNLAGTAPATITGTVIATGKTIANTLKNTTGGTIVYDGTLPGTVPTFDSSWTGTVWLKNFTSVANSLPFGDYGNNSSTIKFTNIAGWMQGIDSSSTLELVDEGENKALTFNNGSSAQTVKVKALKGSGTLTMGKAVTTITGGATPAFTFIAKTAAEFTGSVDVSNMRFIVGIPSDADATFNCEEAGASKVGIWVYSNASATVAVGKTWRVGGLFKWNDGKENTNAGMVQVDGVLNVNGTLTANANAASNNKGRIIIESTGSVSMGSAGSISAVEGITNNGTLKLASTGTLTGTIAGGGTVECNGFQPAITLADSSAWTGTVWIKNIGTGGVDAKVGTKLGNGGIRSSSGTVNDIKDENTVAESWGNANSFVKFTNVRGYMAQADCPWTLVLEDDNSGNKAWYNNNGWAATCAKFKALKGTGTFYNKHAGDVNVCKQQITFTSVDDFTGTIYADGMRIGIGGDSTQATDDTTGRGTIEIKSGTTATIASGKTWTTYRTNGFIVNGTLSVANGGALSGKIAGSGTITYATVPASALTFGTWTGTIELPSFGAGGEDLNNYGVANSKVKLNGVTNGYFGMGTEDSEYTINPEIVLAGNLVLTDSSTRTWRFTKISGSGNFSLTPGAGNYNITVNATKMTDYTGTIVNNMGTAFTVDELALATAPASGTKILSTGGTGTVTLSAVTVGGAAATFGVKRGTDGYYAGYASTTTGDGSGAVTTVDASSEVSEVAVTVPASYSGKVVIPANVKKLTITGETVPAANIGLKAPYAGHADNIYYGIVTIGEGNVVSLNGAATVDGVKVQPEVKTGDSITPMAMGASTPSFKVKTIPGLYYAVRAAGSLSDLAENCKYGEPIQATGSSIDNLEAPTFPGTVIYYKIDAGVDEEELTRTIISTEQVANTPVNDSLFVSDYVDASQCYRIPAMAATPDGSVVMGIYDARTDYYDLGVALTPAGERDKGGTDHYPSIDIGGCYSLDNGGTWSAPEIMIDVANFRDPTTGNKQAALANLTKEMELGDPCLVYDSANSQFVMMGITGGGLTTVGDDKVDVVVYTCSLASVKSGNPKWEGPSSVKAAIETALDDALSSAGLVARPSYDAGYQGILQCPGGGFVLRKTWNGLAAGTVVWPMQYCCKSPATYNGGLFVAWQDDLGDWHATAPISNATYKTQEGALTQLDDGSLYFMAKDWAKTNNEIVRPFFKYDVSSKTWACTDTLPQSVRVQGSMLRIGAKDETSVYAAAFCTGNDTSRQTYVRENLRLFIGTDNSATGGVTWNSTPYCTIYAGDTGTKADPCYGYSSLVMLDETTLGVLSEAHGHIYFTKVDVSSALK